MTEAKTPGKLQAKAGGECGVGAASGCITKSSGVMNDGILE